VDTTLDPAVEVVRHFDIDVVDRQSGSKYVARGARLGERDYDK
jgi:hypothetical protein